MVHDFIKNVCKLAVENQRFRTMLTFSLNHMLLPWEKHRAYMVRRDLLGQIKASCTGEPLDMASIDEQLESMNYKLVR